MADELIADAKSQDFYKAVVERLPEALVVSTPDGKITYTPLANYTGQDTFTYTITDGILSNTATVIVTIVLSQQLYLPIVQIQ